MAVLYHPEPLELLTRDWGHRRSAMSDSGLTLAGWWGLQAAILNSPLDDLAAVTDAH